MRTSRVQNSLTVDHIAVFLKGALTGGAVPVVELEATARDAGLLGHRQTITDSKKFRAAKAALHIKSHRVGFGPCAVWFWELPAPPSAPMPEVLSSPASIAPVSDVYAGGPSPRDIPPSTEALRADAEVATDGVSTRWAPFEWVGGVELLQLRPRPLGIPAHRWQIFIEDCRRFLASPWAERVAAQGWSTASLFGFRYERPHEHLGAAGLAWNLCGGVIVHIYKDGATIMGPDGRRRTFHKRPDRLMTGLPWN